MMIFMGLDLSLTGTGVILIDDHCNIILQKLIRTSNKEKIPATKPIKYSLVLPEERIIRITTEIKEILKKNPVSIYMEGLSFGSQGQSMLELAGLHYSTKVLLKLGKYPYEHIPPTVLKKRITGKGNCKKELMLLQVYKKFGVEFEDNNLCDAYGLARCSMEDYLGVNNIQRRVK